jgi:hypothetical protein
MPKVKVNIRTLSIEQKCTKAARLLKQLTENEKYGRLAAESGRLSAALERMKDTSAAVRALRTEALIMTRQQAAAETALDEELRRLAQLVEVHSGGNEQFITATSLEVVAKAGPSRQPDMPLIQQARPGSSEGSAEVRWLLRKAGRVTFMVQVTPAEEPPAWLQVWAGTKKRCTLEKLIPGTLYAVRVCAVGAGGQGPWSPVMKVRAGWQVV